MVRYADDLVVLCRWKPPETYMPKLQQFLSRLRVTVNDDKTRMIRAQVGFDFLGVHFRKQPSRRDANKWFCYCWPSRRSMQRIRDKVKAAIGRDNRPTLQQKLDRLNPILRGWSAYFGWLNSAQHFRKVDQYVGWKLRLWLQGKHQRRRRAFWKTPLAYWRKVGLYSTQGRIVHMS
jgi:RNA-directed DNA polymerase